MLHSSSAASAGGQQASTTQSATAINPPAPAANQLSWPSPPMFYSQVAPSAYSPYNTMSMMPPPQASGYMSANPSNSMLPFNFPAPPASFPYNPMFPLSLFPNSPNPFMPMPLPLPNLQAMQQAMYMQQSAQDASQQQQQQRMGANPFFTHSLISPSPQIPPPDRRGAQSAAFLGALLPDTTLPPTTHMSSPPMKQTAFMHTSEPMSDKAQQQPPLQGQQVYKLEHSNPPHEQPQQSLSKPHLSPPPPLMTATASALTSSPPPQPSSAAPLPSAPLSPGHGGASPKREPADFTQANGGGGVGGPHRPLAQRVKRPRTSASPGLTPHHPTPQQLEGTHVISHTTTTTSTRVSMVPDPVPGAGSSAPNTPPFPSLLPNHSPATAATTSSSRVPHSAPRSPQLHNKSDTANASTTSANAVPIPAPVRNHITLADAEAMLLESLQKKDKKPSSRTPVACTMCGAVLTRRASLAGHMRIHSGEKPYACRDKNNRGCDQSFRQLSNLYRHRKFHCPKLGKRVRQPMPKRKRNENGSEEEYGEDEEGEMMEGDGEEMQGVVEGEEEGEAGGSTAHADTSSKDGSIGSKQQHTSQRPRRGKHAASPAGAGVSSSLHEVAASNGDATSAAPVNVTATSTVASASAPASTSNSPTPSPSVNTTSAAGGATAVDALVASAGLADMTGGMISISPSSASSAASAASQSTPQV